MTKFKQIAYCFVLFCMIVPLFFAVSAIFSKGITVLSENSPPKINHYFIIDAGHGGIDGGATSVTGILESHINLMISRKLNDIMHLLGLHTIMIRTEDISVYTEGHTIAQKKVSDLKQRVNIANHTPGGILISIHQNYYGDSQYSGAQTFYSKNPQSEILADMLQNEFQRSLNTTRSPKQANGLYLMKNVTCPAVLIECGFISNPAEEKRLLNNDYQIKLACLIACVCSKFNNQASFNQ